VKRRPYRIYAEHVEESALAQFHDAMAQDFVVRGALMPDAHTGYSLPIGAVVATREVVVPAWVGYDIGCGLCAQELGVEAGAVRGAAREIFEAVYAAVPVGFAMHPADQPSQLDPADLSDVGREAFQRRGGFRALGTLGSGNHFIEIGEDERGTAWVVIHSGSRGIGHGIATEFMCLASGSTKPREGHFGLVVGTDLGDAYLGDLHWCLRYALENREHMLRAVRRVVLQVLGRSEAHFDPHLINRNHNHAELKDGQWIHRKGATHAEDGMWGVIPGNMRDGSFIVRGLGKPEALWSSSHGAGRVMGRKQARRQLELAEFQRTMVGITAKINKGTLDESPMAYKSIDEVMALQRDLVEVVHRVHPIVNIKG